jgi:hypothetical protein
VVSSSGELRGQKRGEKEFVHCSLSEQVTVSRFVRNNNVQYSTITIVIAEGRAVDGCQVGGGRRPPGRHAASSLVWRPARVQVKERRNQTTKTLLLHTAQVSQNTVRLWEDHLRASV